MVTLCFAATFVCFFVFDFDFVWVFVFCFWICFCCGYRGRARDRRRSPHRCALEFGSTTVARTQHTGTLDVQTYIRNEMRSFVVVPLLPSGCCCLLSHLPSTSAAIPHPLTPSPPLSPPPPPAGGAGAGGRGGGGGGPPPGCARMQLAASGGLVLPPSAQPPALPPDQPLPGAHPQASGTLVSAQGTGGAGGGAVSISAEVCARASRAAWSATAPPCCRQGTRGDSPDGKSAAFERPGDGAGSSCGVSQPSLRRPNA